MTLFKVFMQNFSFKNDVIFIFLFTFYTTNNETFNTIYFNVSVAVPCISSYDFINILVPVFQVAN